MAKSEYFERERERLDSIGLFLKLDTSKDDLTKEFRLFDKNNDGFIDKNELKVVLQKILPKFQLPDTEIRRMISNVDTNNDGKIDYNGNDR